MKFGSLMYPHLEELIPFINTHIKLDGQRSADELGLQYQDVRESLVETAQVIHQFDP